jgi:branched-chain amino acid transport system permease protein
LSFGFIVEEVFARWESVTGGNSGAASEGTGDASGWKLDSGDRASTFSAWCWR